MASRAQLNRLAERIDALATHLAAPDHNKLPAEWWHVEGDRAWQSENPQQVITFAELEARPTARMRIVSRYVHAENGGPAACCSAGGACYAVHGPITRV